MFGHLGAKVGEQGRKMQQLSEKVGFLEAWRGEGPTQVHGQDLRYPPGWSSHLHLEAQPGGSTWKLLELIELTVEGNFENMASATDRDTRNMCLNARGGLAYIYIFRKKHIYI